MAKHRIRRWFQFGVLDLLILTALAGVGAFLARPVEHRAVKAAPWLCGLWEGGGGAVTLYPDGFFKTYGSFGRAEGLGWQVKRTDEIADWFALDCEGGPHFLVKGEWGSGVIDLRWPDGQVEAQLKQTIQRDGPIRSGKPHGTWQQRSRGGPPIQLDYRDGELVGFRRNSQHSLGDLNALRRLRGLPNVSLSEVAKEKKTP